MSSSSIRIIGDISANNHHPGQPNMQTIEPNRDEVKSKELENLLKKFECLNAENIDLRIALLDINLRAKELCSLAKGFIDISKDIVAAHDTSEDGELLAQRHPDQIAKLLDKFSYANQRKFLILSNDMELKINSIWSSQRSISARVEILNNSPSTV